MKMKPFGKPLARNLLVATSLLFAGSVPMVTHSQTQTPASPSAADKPQQSRAQQLMGDIAPKMAELTDGVLFGDIWERPQLSKRDRSLVTVSALMRSTGQTSFAPILPSPARTA
jgi:4-carboxymuconolactone decarboxylase